MIFTDTVTWYHHEDGRWERVVLEGVQWKSKSEVTIDSNGSLQVVDYASITIPFTGEKYEFGTDNLDLMVLGVCQEEVYEQTFREIADLGVTIKSVSDNTHRDHLKHWRIIAK